MLLQFLVCMLFLWVTCRLRGQNLTGRDFRYGRIWISGAESADMKKRMKIKHGCRALLLRRTLLSRPDYAARVRELKLPEYDPSTMTARETKDIRGITASVVGCCTNLERFIGYYQHYKAESDDTIQLALTARRSLKEHIWIMASNGQMQMQQSEEFINAHAIWSSLEILVLQGNPGSGSGSLSGLTFSGVFHRLPRLKKLLISRFHDYEFNNTTLMAIPEHVECIRLDDLPGVTDSGISEFVERLAPHGRLRSLALLNLGIQYLRVVLKILLSLSNLEKFTLLQTSSPQLPLEVRNRKSKFLLSSKSLKFLHWDVLVPGPANVVLARSIRANEFPSLRTLRAPSDHHGILQSVCKPHEKILLPFDKIEASLITTKQRQEQNQYYYPEQRYCRSLPEARINAQERIEAARKSPSIKIIVTDADERNWEVDLGTFMGDWMSKVTYSLLPDLDGAEEAVVDVPGFLLARIKSEWKWASGCCGKWNKSIVAQDHTERARGRSDLGLDLLF